MVEANIHLRPLHTTRLDIYKVFETLVCCLKGIWLHPYSITLAKLPPDLWIPSEEQNFDLAKLIFIRVWYVHADLINFISIQSILFRSN
jgi:hypothetical protein